MGLTLEQIAVETRIGTRFLEAIETEQFHLLPGGIFSRGFVRSYAERLKLDPDQAVADFERQSSYREPALMEGLRVSAPVPEKKHRSLYPVAIGALVLLIIVFYIATRESPRSVSAGQPAARAATPPVTASAPTPAPPAAPTPSPVVPESPAPAQSIPAPTTAPPTANPTPAVAQAAPEPAKQALSIVLSAHDETWLKVASDGTTVNAGEILKAGTTRRYTAQSTIALTVGNAGGVDVQVNDHALRPLGKNGQVRSITITPENLKDLFE